MTSTFSYELLAACRLVWISRSQTFDVLCFVQLYASSTALSRMFSQGTITPMSTT